MTEEANCPNCGQPLSAAAPHGLCPSCLLREGLETVQDPSEAPTLATPPAGQLDLDPPSAALLARDLKGRYTNARETGRGGMGRVMLVRDGQLGREVALKELLPDARSPETDGAHPLAARFAREARITAQLQHPAITPVYELGCREDGTFYYTMKFVRGKSLSQAIALARTLEGRLRLLPHFVDLCQAIAYAHSRGVLHRDVKPGNVIVGEFGETVVVDWGLAKLRGSPGEAEGVASRRGGSLPADDAEMTAHGHALGTPSYMPPEQARGLLDELDERSDVYSLGAVLYEILTGRNPYSGPSAAAVVSSVIAGPPLPPRSIDRNVPREYAAICARAMARDRADRPSSALALATEIENVRVRPRKGGARQILERLAAAAVLAMPLLLLLANWQSEKALDSAVERMSAKGIDVRFGRPEDFLAPPPVPSIASTTAPIAASAIGALYALPWRFPDLADKESSLWQSLRSLEHAGQGAGEHPTPEDSRRAQELIRANQPLLAALHEMARLPPGDSRAVFRQAASSSQTPFDWQIPDFVALRGAALLLSLEARLADLEGHPEAAFDGLARILDLSNQCGQLPWLISSLRRFILAGVALDGFERMQDRLVGGQDAQAFEIALGQLSPRTELLQGVLGELKSILAAFDLLKRRSARDGASGFADSPLSLANLGWTLYGSRPLRFWINSDEILYLGFMTDYVEAIRRPYWEGRAELRRIDTESERALGPSHPVTRMVLARLDRAAGRAAAVESRAIRARLRLALHRYRARTGAYPESLDNLRPLELAELPRDPVSGQPVEYRLTPNGYFLSPALTPDGGGA